MGETCKREVFSCRPSEEKRTWDYNKISEEKKVNFFSSSVILIFQN